MHKIFSLIVISMLVYIPSSEVFGMSEAPTEVFTNENWETETHPQIAEFSVRSDGSAYGVTVTGIAFRQYPIPSPQNIRIQRFEIQDHYHYIVDGKIVRTFTELSLLLAQALPSEREVAS